MKSLIGLVLFFLGLFMLAGSFKAHEREINGCTQNSFMGAFEYYDKLMEAHPAIQGMSGLMDWGASPLLNSLNIIVSLLFMVVGTFLVLNLGSMTPMIEALFLGATILVIAFSFRSIRLHLN
jgi:hypothetical protein